MNNLVFNFTSYLIFLPSITFSILNAEIFPWAIIFSLLYAVKIDKGFFYIILLFLLSSLYGYFQSEGRISIEILRSIMAYLNAMLVLSFLLQTNFSLVKKLFPVLKNIFFFLIVLGSLQFLGIINFLDPVIKTLVPRGSADSLELYERGVKLLSTEPSRASYEFLFIYIAYRTIFLDNKKCLGFDLFVTVFMLFFIKSITAFFLMGIFFMAFYRLKFIFPALFVLFIFPPLFDQFAGRGFSLATILLSSNSLESVYQLILNASGFRFISISASFQYGFQEFFGGGIGNWQQSSIQALELTGLNSQDIAYFRDISDGQWVSLRPISYIAALMLDLGITGTIIVSYYFYSILQKFYKIDKNSKSIIFIFVVYLFSMGSVGNPVPFISTAIALRYLYAKNLEIKQEKNES